MHSHKCTQPNPPIIIAEALIAKSNAVNSHCLDLSPGPNLLLSGGNDMNMQLENAIQPIHNGAEIEVAYLRVGVQRM